MVPQRTTAPSRVFRPALAHAISTWSLADTVSAVTDLKRPKSAYSIFQNRPKNVKFIFWAVDYHTVRRFSLAGGDRRE